MLMLRIRNQNQSSKACRILFGVTALILALVLPNKVTGQNGCPPGGPGTGPIDCSRCNFSTSLGVNIFGTNCSGFLVPGTAHAGETVFVRLRVQNTECCCVPTNAPFQAPFNNWIFATNIFSTVDAAGCTNFTTANLIAGTPILEKVCFDTLNQFATSIGVSNVFY